MRPGLPAVLAAPRSRSVSSLAGPHHVAARHRSIARTPAAGRARAGGAGAPRPARAPKLRIVAILAAIRGHDVGEVARLLQLPEGTVKSRLFLARRKLAEKLQCLAND